MASLIAAHGTEAAENWARDFVSNLARKPQGNDRAQAKAISQGICDVAIMNSYYYGNMKFSDDADQRLWAGSLRLILPISKIAVIISIFRVPDRQTQPEQKRGACIS